MGEHLDIHCGGIDNAFPHHTNEIAQSEAFIGHKWCNFWFHVLHLNTNSGKMSKSKGEFLTVSLLEEKGYNPLAYRFFCLQSHYRKQLVFSYENLDGAATAYDKLLKRIATLKANDADELDMDAVAKLQGSFKEALDNDINTSLAVTAVYDVLKANTNDKTKLYLLADFDKVLSLDLIEGAKKLSETKEEPQGEKDELTLYVEEQIALRAAAKKEKNFAEADRIRNELLEKGIKLLDTREGTTWSKE